MNKTMPPDRDQSMPKLRDLSVCVTPYQLALDQGWNLCVRSLLAQPSKAQLEKDWQRDCSDYPNCPNLSCPCELKAQLRKAQSDPMQELADQAQELDTGYGKAQGGEDAVAEVVAQDTSINGNARAIKHLYAINCKDDLLPVGTKLYLQPAKPAAEPVVPDGWVLVPREPTGKMIKASDDISSRSEGRDHWEAMLAAAPKGVI